MSRCAKRIVLCTVVAAMSPAPSAAEEVDAILHWSKRVELGVPVSGVVSEVRVEVGDRVEKDQILLTLDPRRFEHGLAEARARTERLAPELAEARRELERAEDLYDRTLLSDHDLRLAEIAVAKLEARSRAAAARTARAELRLARSMLRAPFDGVVVRLDAAVGQTVVSRCAATPLVTLADGERLVARAALPAARIAGIAPGEAVSVVVDGERLDARVQRLGLEPLDGTGDAPRYALDVLLAAPPGGPPRVGRRVTLVLP